MERIILSLGGSLIVPEKIDTKFLKRFREFILARPEKFVIVCGGGKIARDYMESAKKLIETHDQELDWLGIKTTQINAELVRCIFGKHAYKEILSEPCEEIIKSRKKVLIVSGWKPGFSSDYDAVLYAKLFNSSIINLTNIDHVYDKDPRKSSKARKIKNLTWRDYLSMIDTHWKAGKNSPFDPVASKAAKDRKVYIINGKRLMELEKILDGKTFNGTLLHP